TPRAAPPPPRHADARRRAGSGAVPRHPARGQLRRPGRPVPRPRAPPQRGRGPGGNEGPLARSAQQHGPARPRGPGPAPLRAADQRRGRPGSGAGDVGRQQALRAGPETAQGHPRRHARRPRGVVTMTAPGSDREPVERLAEEFADRYRRGERPSLTEYVQRYPDLGQEIRELFPALVLMEKFGSVAGEPPGPHLAPSPPQP